MEPQKLNDDGRWWRLDGHDVDLRADVDGTPLIVRAAVLAFRDKLTDEDQDVSELLLWTITEHPPWTGECGTCGPTCSTLGRSEYVAVEWLVSQSRALIERSRANLCRKEAS